MNRAFWATVLQWSRLGTGALVLLVSARFLTLAEIGLFASAYAPVRLVQMSLRGALIDTGVVIAHKPAGRAGLWGVALGLGLVASLIAVGAVLVIPAAAAPLLCALAPLPFIAALGAVPEARLRRHLRLRALALRNVAANAVAAASALAALAAGAGAWALVCFALCLGLTSTGIALALLPSLPRQRVSMAVICVAWRRAAPLGARDLVAAAPIPLVQITIGLSLGLPAAGAFQIAARLGSLLDSLCVAPLRYIALPMVAQTRYRHARFATMLRLSAGVAGTVFPVAYISAPTLLPILVGAESATAIGPLVTPFCVLGAMAAISMPFVQLATSANATHIALGRAIFCLMLTAMLLALSLPHGLVVTAWATAGASGVANLWFYLRLGQRLALSPLAILGATLPGATCATILILIAEGHVIPGLCLAVAATAWATPLVMRRLA